MTTMATGDEQVGEGRWPAWNCRVEIMSRCRRTAEKRQDRLMFCNLATVGIYRAYGSMTKVATTERSGLFFMSDMHVRDQIPSGAVKAPWDLLMGRESGSWQGRRHGKVSIS
jgi:hypothetical protein